MTLHRKPSKVASAADAHSGVTSMPWPETSHWPGVAVGAHSVAQYSKMSTPAAAASVEAATTSYAQHSKGKKGISDWSFPGQLHSHPIIGSYARVLVDPSGHSASVAAASASVDRTATFAARPPSNLARLTSMGRKAVSSE